MQTMMEAAVDKKAPPLLTARELTPKERVMIGGEDANANGVRDDIDKVLQKSARITPAQRLALTQSFKATQTALLVNLDDDNAVNKARTDLLESWQCVGQHFGFDKQKPGIIQFIATIESQSNNTPERQNRYDNLGCDAVKVLLIDPAKASQLNPTPCNF